MPRRRASSASRKPAGSRNKQSVLGPTCAYCGKRSYGSRKEARAVARAVYPTEHMSAYPCTQAPEGTDTSRLWHLGHLAKNVLEGRVDKGRAHGGPQLEKARPERRGPIPAALRVTIAAGRPEKSGEDNDEGDPVPTIGETAVLTLTGFDRSKGKYRGVTAHSPVKDQVALVHGALRAFALTHSFEPMEEFGHEGFVGRVSVRGVCRELFESEKVEGDRLDQMARAITQAGNKAGLLRCVDSATRTDGQLPVWWVAADYSDAVGHPPLADRPEPAPAKKTTSAPIERTTQPQPAPPAEGAKDPERVARGKAGAETRKRQGKPPGRAKGSRNRTRIELLSLAERTLKELGRPVLLVELYEHADFPVAKNSLRDSLNELARERRIYRRPLTPEDRRALKAAGGPTRGLGASTYVLAHSSIAPLVDGARQIGTVTWAPPPPAAEGEAPTAHERVEEGNALAKAAGRAAGEVTREAQAEGSLPDDELDDEIAALEAAAKRPKPAAPEAAEIEELRAMVVDLETRLAKVTRQRDRLLAVVKTMGDDE